MNQPIALKTTSLEARNSNSTIAHYFFPVVVAFALLVLSHETLAVTPAPDGGYANGNTAEGTNALFSLTTGGGNTASGYTALIFNTIR